jgi:hypothetical protein
MDMTQQPYPYRGYRISVEQQDWSTNPGEHSTHILIMPANGNWHTIDCALTTTADAVNKGRELVDRLLGDSAPPEAAERAWALTRDYRGKGELAGDAYFVNLETGVSVSWWASHERLTYNPGRNERLLEGEQARYAYHRICARLIPDFPTEIVE